MKIQEKRLTLTIFFGLGLSPLLFAQVNPIKASSIGADDGRVSSRGQQLSDLVAEQREAESLARALEILKAVPVDGSSLVPDGPGRRHEALEALKAFDALDEYQRKIKAYYKDDKSNPIYDRLMVECLLLTKPEETTPYLERLYALNPNDFGVGINLARRYSETGNDQALLPVVELLLKEDFNRTVASYCTDIVALFRRTQQLPSLVELYEDAGKVPGAVPSGVTQSLILPLIQSATKEEQIAHYKILVENDDRQGSWDNRKKLVELMAEVGDKDGVGEQCEQIFFSDSRPKMNGGMNFLPENTQLPGIWNWDAGDIPYATGLDVIRTARSFEQIERLKKRARSEIAAHPKDAFLKELLVLITVFGHDAETFTLLPDYLKEVVARSQSGRGGTPYISVYAIFGELLRWPEAKDLLQPTLEAGYKAEMNSQPGRYIDAAPRVARMALEINDQDLTRDVLNRALTGCGIIPPVAGVPLPPKANIFFEGLGAIGAALIDDGMSKELDALVPVIMDPSRSPQGRFPDSRAETLARLGEAAFDAGLMPSAKLCAESAVKQLQQGWQDPSQSSNGYYSVTVSPQSVHLTCDLLLRLGLTDSFDNLQALLSQPTAAGITLNAAQMLGDTNRLRLMLGEHPGGLTPALWLVPSTDTGGSLTRKVAWDMMARTDDGRGSESRSFSIQARDMPQLDGKLTLQITAGAAADDLRLVKTVTNAKTRGTTDVVLKSDDRFIRVLCQTTESEPKIFVGLITPISMGENLFPTSFHVGFSIFNGGAEPWTTDDTVNVCSRSGGPEKEGSYQTVICPTSYAAMDLLGSPQKIVPGTTYLQSGWLKGSGQWGVRYLDAEGNKISDGQMFCQGQADDWHYEQQTIGQAPPNTVAMVPFLSIGQSGTLNFQNLYLGVLEQSPPLAPGERTDLISGLQGATSIAEAPQGETIAVTFKDGSVRCFDLATRLELGTLAKLPAPAIDVAFFNQGREIVAADATGHVLIRPVEGVGQAGVIYQAPWPVDLLSASSDFPLLAVANRAEAKLSVVDLSTGREVSNFGVNPGPVTTVVMSPDGKQVFCRHFNRTGGIWNTSTGEAIAVKPAWIHEVALAHYFKIPHALKISEATGISYVQVQSDFVLGSDGSSLDYSMLYNANSLHRIETGPITAFCLSSQNNDAYTVDTKGTLALWKFPDSLKIPPFNPPTEIQVVAPITTPSAAPKPTGLMVAVPERLRGFPKTTLSQVLEITVQKSVPIPVDPPELNGQGPQTTASPAAGVEVEVQSDLKGVTFTSADDSGKPTPHHTIKLKTDSQGKARVLVMLGAQPGQGKITITASAGELTRVQEIDLESIDETAPLKQPRDVSVVSEGSAMVVTWNDGHDNRTGFLIQRKVNTGPWRPIAFLPENGTSYYDRAVSYDYQYNYQIISTNESKYGYPPKLPSPPDRLGNFLP